MNPVQNITPYDLFDRKYNYRLSKIPIELIIRIFSCLTTKFNDTLKTYATMILLSKEIKVCAEDIHFEPRAKAF